MRWASYGYLVATAAQGAAGVIKCSDLEFPTIADSHNPRNYAIYTERFTHYRVLGVKYKITFRTRNYQDSPTFEGRPILCYAYPHQTQFNYIAASGFPTVASYESFIETTCMLRTVRCGTLLRTTYNSTLPDKVTLKGFVRTRDWYDQAELDYQGIYGFSPTATGPFITYGFTDMSGTVFADCGVDVLVRLKFIVRSTEPKLIVQET